MRSFKYKAITKSGSKINGAASFLNVEELKKELYSRKQILISFQEIKHSKIFFKNLDYDIKTFFYNLGVLLENKASLCDSLEILSEMIESKELKLSVTEIIFDMTSGLKFSKALEKHSHIFDNFIIRCIKSAEEVGQMQYICKIIGEFIETKMNFVSKARKALFYPKCVILAITVLFVIALKYLIPSMKDFFISQDNTAYSGKFLFSLSDYVLKIPNIYLIFAIAAVLLISKQKQNINRILKYNLFKDKYTQKYEWLAWGQIFSILLQASVPIKEALLFSKKYFLSNNGIKNIKNITDEVFKGVLLSDALSHQNHVPKNFIKFIKIGESCGELGKMLAQCVLFEQKKFMDTIEKRIALLPPVLLAIAGFLIIWLISTILFPLYENITL